MTRYVLSPRLGPDDTFTPTPRGDEKIAVFDIFPRTNLLLGIGEVLKDLKKEGGTPTAVGLELLLLALLVYIADTKFNRMRASQDGWTREIGLYLPVQKPSDWLPAKAMLERMLRFLTGDIWVIDFRSWNGQLVQPKSQPSLLGPRFNSISLFSGGLDSLIGAINKLDAGGENILFVSHKADPTISRPQQDLFEKIAESFPVVAPGNLRLPSGRLPRIFPELGGENSTRGRSFLFIALAAFAGSSIGKPFPIYVPENGLISLNVPLDPTRLASNSTRTTHPYYFHRWNDVLRIVGIPGTVQNPFWNKTKGEMILECSRPDILASTAAQSISCAKPAHGRWEASKDKHCGYCLPCIIRRASFLKAKNVLADPTNYRMIDPATADLDSTNKKGEQYRGFEYAIARLNEKSSRARTFIYKTGPLLEDMDRIDELEDVYRRGMKEVEEFIKGVSTISSKAQ